MIVKELIAKLRTYDPDRVVIGHDQENTHVEYVGTILGSPANGPILIVPKEKWDSDTA